MAKKKWIKGATENAHGQFAEKAKAAGKSTREYAEEHRHSPGKLGKEARLALTLMGMHHHGGKTKTQKVHRSTADARKALYGAP